MVIIGLDPGKTKSAYCMLDGVVGPACWKLDNNDVRSVLRRMDPSYTLVIERVASYGNAIGDDILETVYYSGRFAECFPGRVERIFRKTVVGHLCNNPKANDSNVRQALIDRYGGDSIAIGGKKCQVCGGQGWRGRDHEVCRRCLGACLETPVGPLKGIYADCWAALAVAVAWRDGAR